MNKNMLVIAPVVIVLNGCAAPAPTAPVAMEDLNVGIAKICTATPVDLTSGPTASATIDMTNDGWCAVHTRDKAGQPFQLGLLRARPQHGRVLIQKIGGETRIEYTAENRYVGADRFTVALRSSALNTPDATVQVAVVTTMGEGLAPPPAATAPPRANSSGSSSRPSSQSNRGQ